MKLDMVCSKEFSITINSQLPWSTLVWDQLDGVIGAGGGSFVSDGEQGTWAGRAVGGNPIQQSVSSGHAIGTYNGPLLNCLLEYNLIVPPTVFGIGAAVVIKQNGVAILNKSDGAGDILPGVNTFPFALLNTLGADQSIELQGGINGGGFTNAFVIATAPNTVTQASVRVYLA